MDPRFARVYSDPRFRRDPKRNRRRTAGRGRSGDGVQGRPASDHTWGIGEGTRRRKDQEDVAGEEDDPRFTVWEDDERYKAMVRPRVDKYGRPRADSGTAEHEADISHREISAEEKDSDEDEDEEEVLVDPLAEDEQGLEWGDAARRLALFSIDWDNLTAVDILATFRSFCPSDGQVKQVVIYPSNFGLEEMKKESLMGPSVVSKTAEQLMENVQNAGAIGKTKRSRDLQTRQRTADSDVDPMDPRRIVPESDEENEGNGIDGDSSSSDVDDEPDVLAHFKVDAKKAEERQREAIRTYERQRLKYYYAVMDCDSVATANHLYDQCDGVEYEGSGNCFDLRFVPDHVVLENPPRDVANEVPSNYQPPSFNSKALQNTNVELTWDTDARDRIVLRKKYLKKDEVLEQDLQAYLASESESEKSDDLEHKRALLLGDADGGKGSGEDDEEEEAAEEELDDNDQEQEEESEGLEITFEPGAVTSRHACFDSLTRKVDAGSGILQAKAEKEMRANESPWEARMRRLKERKKQKRKELKEARQNKSAGKAEVSGEKEDADGFFQEDDEEEEAQQTELLPGRDEEHAQRSHMWDQDSDEEEGSRKPRGKLRSRAARRAEKERKANKESMGFKADLEDDRFQQLFTSHEFALDPTHPKYLKNSGTGAILKAREERRKTSSSSKRPDQSLQAQAREKRGADETPSDQRSNQELKSLAERVKRKVSGATGALKRRRTAV